MAVVRNPELIHTNWLSRGEHEGELIHTNSRERGDRRMKVKNFTDVPDLGSSIHLLCSREHVLCGFTGQSKIFTDVNIFIGNIRAIFWSLKNRHYFLFSKFLRTDGACVGFMIEIERGEDRWSAR
jgi:hypothetical protein